MPKPQEPPTTMGIRASKVFMDGKLTWVMISVANLSGLFAAKFFFFPQERFLDLLDAKFYMWAAITILASPLLAKALVRLWLLFLVAELRALRRGMKPGGIDHRVFVVLICVIPWIVQAVIYMGLFYVAHLVVAAIW